MIDFVNDISGLHALSPEQELEVNVASCVFPFKTTKYVIEELIDWDDIPHDPIFQLNFPQRKMLADSDFESLRNCYVNEGKESAVKKIAIPIRNRSVLSLASKNLATPLISKREGAPGLWHQIPATILLFPGPSQPCFAHCNYCGRWMMHTITSKHSFYSDPITPVPYINKHTEITDVLITGGDSMFMTAGDLKNYIEPLLHIPHIQTIRLATKSLSYWPYRFISDKDSNDIISLFEHIVSDGKHLTVMAHVSHPRELSTDIVQHAISIIKSTGAAIRCQNPFAKNINDSVQVLRELWRTEISLGLIPYYLFIDNSIGLNKYFQCPIVSIHEIFKSAKKGLSGLAQTVRGPVLMDTLGKILVDDVLNIAGKKVISLKYVQAGDNDLVGRTFFAEFDAHATEFEQLKPAFKESESYFREGP